MQSTGRLTNQSTTKDNIGCRNNSTVNTLGTVYPYVYICWILPVLSQVENVPIRTRHGVLMNTKIASFFFIQAFSRLQRVSERERELGFLYGILVLSLVFAHNTISFFFISPKFISLSGEFFLCSFPPPSYVNFLAMLLFTLEFYWRTAQNSLFGLRKEYSWHYNGWVSVPGY